jgi:hypothetical protein
MASTSASSRPSNPKWKKNLKQPGLEREVKDCDFSYFSDLECESESKSDTSESFVYYDDSGWQKVGVGDVGPKGHGFTATSMRPKIHLTVELLRGLILVPGKYHEKLCNGYQLIPQ